ncbi:MAG: Unknown protein [uncultured Sulfurovum sp.]|uniref:Disease resistance R13L4/SHOC-2-like LRR domain-containing protein n=2 Tax=Pseudomonadati TaxID=3379134 RepID=A0A6S6UGT5_9BACT|nr:MAG: Unknown protein [uncultured Sulfurovum sp.]
MKVIIFSLSLLILISIEIKAQSCKNLCPSYLELIKLVEKKGDENAQTKLNYYRAAIVAAKDCNCPVLEGNANKKIDELFKKIEAEKEKAQALSRTILKQKNKIDIALGEAEEANEKNLKIINAMEFYDGKYALAFKDNNYGFIDKDGNPNPNISFEYKKGEPFDRITGFAEMEDRKNIKYLIDTSGNKYRLINISEGLKYKDGRKINLSTDDLRYFENKLVTNKSEKIIFDELKQKLETLNQIEDNIKLVNQELINTLNKTEDRLALDLSEMKKKDILNILKNILKENLIKDKVELLFLNNTYDLDTLPDLILEFKNLRELDLSWTNAFALPLSLGQLDKLVRLDIYGSQIGSIPETIDKLKNLKILVLSESLGSEGLPNPNRIFGLKNLEYLDLSGTELESIPETIGQLTKLKSLSLPNSLKILPNSIGGLKNLEYLDLSSTELESIPETIGQLTKLKSLSLPNSLKILPNSIGGLKNLEGLFFEDRRFEYSQLESIPETIGQLTKLKSLSLPNSLKILPNIFLLENLEGLYIRDNPDIQIYDINKLKKLKNFSYTLYKDNPINKAKLKALQKELPNCNFDITNEQGISINLSESNN